MKLLKRHKDILNKLIKGKGQFNTDRIKKEQTDGNTLSDLVKLYLQGLCDKNDKVLLVSKIDEIISHPDISCFFTSKWKSKIFTLIISYILNDFFTIF